MGQVGGCAYSGTKKEMSKGREMKSLISRGALLIVVTTSFLFSGCAYRTTLTDISSVNSANEVIVVGRIEIEPRIEKKDVSVKMTLGGDDLYRTFVLRIRNDVGETTNYMNDQENAAVVYTDEDFYIPYDRSETVKIFGGWFYTQLSGGAGVSMSTVLFRIIGGLKAEYPKNAKAVYIGTIKFKRDEFYNLKAINFSQDDFSAAQKRFKSKFGTKMHLEKATIGKVTS